MTQRIYIVGMPNNEIRLIRATVRSQALSHVANSMLNIRVASQEDLVEAIGKGLSVENAKAPEQLEIQV